MDDLRIRRPFRRRLLAVMLAAGLLPLLGGGLVAGLGLSRMLSLSLAPLDPLLERAQRTAPDPALARDLSRRVSICCKRSSRADPSRTSRPGRSSAR